MRYRSPIDCANRCRIPPFRWASSATSPLMRLSTPYAKQGWTACSCCGEEPLEYCQSVLDHAQVIKVLHVPTDADTASVEELADQIDTYSTAGCVVTLDSQVPGLHGGTGQSFDWSVAGRLSASGRRFLLAGGLTPDNVSQAISVAKPWGVDVSSGVETDGEQDHDKIRDFVANARRGSPSAEVS